MEYLTISTLSNKEINPINEIAKIAAKHECNIIFSQMYALGSDFAAIIHVGGNWSSIAKMEASLPSLIKHNELQMQIKRTQYEKSKHPYLPYTAQIFALDQPSLVYEISDFFETQEIYIEKWKSSSSLSKNDTSVFTLELSILIPGDANIADIREQFLIFCDEQNLDGNIEPEYE